MEKTEFLFLRFSQLCLSMSVFLGYDALLIGDCISKFRGNSIFVSKFNLYTTDDLQGYS